MVFYFCPAAYPTENCSTLLKKIIRQAIGILNSRERAQLGRLSLLQAVVSIADIGSLVLLLFIIQLYTGDGTSIPAPVAGLLQVHYLAPALAFLLLFILKNLLAYTVVRWQYGYVYRVASRLSLLNLKRYLNGPYEDYVTTDSSVSVNRISNLPVQFSHYVLAGIQQLFTEGTLTLVAVIAILGFQPGLFLVLLLVIVPPVIVTALIARRKLRTARAEVKDNAEKTTQYLREALDSYIESNIFDKKAFFSYRYSGRQQKLNDFLARLQITQALPSRFTEVFAVAGLLLLIILNKYGASSGSQLINIGAFMAAAYKIIPGITRIAALSGQIRTYAFTLHDLSPGAPAATAPYNQVRERVQSIAFHQVCFRYGQKEVLADTSLALHPGDFLGIASASGKGKTTLVHLLLGLLQQHAGNILFNDIVLTAAERKAFWPAFSYVKQQQFLIHDTLLRNITLEEEGYDADRLQKAVAASGLDTVLAAFPEGLDKIVSDSGRNLSGGQRQRVALARALYRDADVFILDEPFSELDQASEQHILRHLQTLAVSGKIIILISHNPQSLLFCNQTLSVHD